MSVWGLYCIWNTDFLMPHIGGDNGFSALKNALSSYPQSGPEVMSRGIHYYYLVQIGYRVETTLYLMLANNEPKYYEYLMHHLMAVHCTIFSYETGMFPAGMQVLICHDLSDCVVQIARFYIDYKHKTSMIE